MGNVNANSRVASIVDTVTLNLIQKSGVMSLSATFTGVDLSSESKMERV